MRRDLPNSHTHLRDVISEDARNLTFANSEVSRRRNRGPPFSVTRRCVAVYVVTALPSKVQSYTILHDFRTFRNVRNPHRHIPKYRNPPPDLSFCHFTYFAMSSLSVWPGSKPRTSPPYTALWNFDLFLHIRVLLSNYIFDKKTKHSLPLSCLNYGSQNYEALNYAQNFSK
jgi:hypothetical protein